MIHIACPACGTADPRRITYGLDVAPTPDDEITRGCLRPTDAPDWQCRACGHEWALPPMVSTTPCPDCDTLLHRIGPTTLQCPQCRCTHTGGTYQVFDPMTPADQIVELLDIDYDNNTNADGEPINWNGQTREEELEMFVDMLERRLVNIPGVGWISEEEAVEELGAEAVAAELEQLRIDVTRMRAELTDTQNQQPPS